MLFFIPALLAVGGAIAASLSGNAIQQPLALELTHHHWSSDETIYEELSHHKEFSKLVKAIDFAGKIGSVLNDTSAERHLEFQDIVSSAQGYDLADAIALVEEFQVTKGGNDEDKKRLKKFLKKLVRAILSYHILPHKFDAQHLAGNNTFPTHLVLPEAFGSRPLRIRVSHSLITPVPIINFYSKVIKPDNKASNAIQRTGLTDLLDLRYSHGKSGEKGSYIGSNTVTVFAPTNHAFELLPKKLRLFLFSSFGTRTLRKILQYHIVPGLVFHTDHVYNNTDGKVHPDHKRKTYDLSKIGALGTDVYPLEYWDSYDGVTMASSSIRSAEGQERAIAPHAMDHHPKPIESFDVELSSALANHTLHAHVEKFRFSLPIPNPHNPHIITTKFTINGLQVVVPDAVGLNGAVHVIEHLLDPRGHSHHAQTAWEDWEEWLPQWAAAEN
ncbi:hypothetical protein C0993_008060 [Termitomyces sp. T159_Od127]|nr:hypothetical protein C0993_008060 [Termitomyces sp. T159_Od127]